MQAPKRVASAKRDGAHKKPVKTGGRRARPSAYHQGLTRDGIAAAALALIDREGLDALSYRRLAEAIGCEAMSLYHYFPSKAHLTDAVIDRVFGALEVPPPGRDWLDRVRKAAWNYRAMALRHPKLYPLMAVHRLNTAVGVRKLDQIIGLFRDGGFDDATAARLFREVGYYLTGAALDETAGYANGPSAAEPVTDAEIARDCPNLAAVAPFFKPQHFEQTFAAGLEMLLQDLGRLRKKA
jgi:AcrR family transcriptional regulator